MSHGRDDVPVVLSGEAGTCSSNTVLIKWAEEIRGLMGEKGLTEEDWNDRGNWRKKII